MVYNYNQERREGMDDYIVIVTALISLVTAVIQLFTAILTYKTYKEQKRDNQ